jgi:hypothetical protein
MHNTIIKMNEGEQHSAIMIRMNEGEQHSAMHNTMIRMRESSTVPCTTP